MHYRRAIQIELRLHDIPYEVKKKVTIMFRNKPLAERETRLIIVDNKIILIPLAVQKITLAMQGRLRQYLKMLGFKLGLITNFHTPQLTFKSSVMIWSILISDLTGIFFVHLSCLLILMGGGGFSNTEIKFAINSSL